MHSNGGFSKEIPLEIIQYGDPDNSGKRSERLQSDIY